MGAKDGGTRRCERHGKAVTLVFFWEGTHIFLEWLTFGGMFLTRGWRFGPDQPRTTSRSAARETCHLGATNDRMLGCKFVTTCLSNN